MSKTELISSSDVAQMLKVSIREVQRRARSGAVPTAHKIEGITGAYLFDRSQIEALAQGDAK